MKFNFPSKVEFYITNVCNYTCDNCNRFNNHKFSGGQRWSAYEADYRRWAELVDLSSIVIMGGEPLLNPTVVDWVRGASEIFEADVQVLTNATRIHQTPGLYEAMVERSPIKGQRRHIGISLHNMADFDTLRANVLEFLQGPVLEFGTRLGIPAPNPPAPDYGAYWSAYDANGVLVNMWISNHFFPAAVQLNEQGRFTLHNSNVEAAYSNCAFARFKSYHFIRGKLYKCGPVALLTEFDQQKNLDITDEDRALIHSYRPLTPDNYADYSEEFFESLNGPIPNCKFCSSYTSGTVITPVRKGLVKQ